jgi:hypothetical protein
LNFINIILGIILIILIIIFIGLFLGLRISLNLNKKGMNITGFIHIILFEKIAIIKKEFPDENKEESEEVEEVENTEESLKENYNKIKPVIPDIKQTLPYFYNFLKKSLKSIEINKFYFHIDFGFSSYTETAKLVGYFWSFAVIPNTLIKSCSLSACPIFTNPTLDFDADINIKIKVINMIPPLIQLITKKEFINLLKGIRVMNKNEG